MPPRRSRPAVSAGSGEGRIVDVDVGSEMRSSFLEYAYSVIYSRALPDARDGLKPVQRRILYQMAQLGLRPDRGHVKSARVVGEVMGRLHPHGDSAIYDALVRMAQPFSMRLPLIDGHGNFGSPDDGPAAMRYTECRLSAAALLLTDALDEQVVDMVANYDGRETEPVVLPAAYPCLLVNGAAGIAVGMATTLAPHNLGEVIAAARLRLAQPACGLPEVMAVLPGPDLPTGGIVSGQAGVVEAYATGRGTFRIRARVHVERLTARRNALIVTELPYSVGPERVIARIRELVNARTLTEVADLTDLTDMAQGTRLVIGLKSGVDPAQALATLYRLTPLEESFSINAVALVDGQPRTLGLLELLDVYLDHRLTVTRRRSAYRLDRAESRRHLVEGLLRAILDIDEVIALIRMSDTVRAARDGLMSRFALTPVQADAILDVPLRRLTRFSQLELETEAATLADEIADLRGLLADAHLLRTLVSEELGAVAAAHASPRRTALVEQEVGALAPDPDPGAGMRPEVAAGGAPAGPMPNLAGGWRVFLSVTGLLARAQEGASSPGPETADALVACSWVQAPTGIVLVTDRGRAIPIDLRTLPAADRNGARGGSPASGIAGLDASERAVGLVPGDHSGDVVVVTDRGQVKRCRMSDRPAADGPWPLLPALDGDRVVAALALPAEIGPAGGCDLVCVTRAGQALRFDPATVRPQGRQGRGVLGVRLSAGDGVLTAHLAGPADLLVTVARLAGALPGAESGTVKVTPLSEVPRQGRGAAGVRVMRWRRGEEGLAVAVVAAHPIALSSHGAVLALPPATARGGSGTPVTAPVAVLGFSHD